MIGKGNPTGGWETQCEPRILEVTRGTNWDPESEGRQEKRWIWMRSKRKRHRTCDWTIREGKIGAGIEWKSKWVMLPFTKMMNLRVRDRFGGSEDYLISGMWLAFLEDYLTEAVNRSWDTTGSQKYLLTEWIHKQLDMKVDGSGPAMVVWLFLVWNKSQLPTMTFWGTLIL